MGLELQIKKISFILITSFLFILPLFQIFKVEEILSLKNDLFGFFRPFSQNVFLIRI